MILNELLDDLSAASATKTPVAEWRKQFRDGLARSGDATGEQIVELPRETKSGRADHRAPARESSQSGVPG